MPGWWRRDKAIAPGGTITVALEENIAPGWHTYWINPGDAGAATDIHWTLAAGLESGRDPVAAPKRLPVGPFMDYGYEGTPWLLTNARLRPPMPRMIRGQLP